MLHEKLLRTLEKCCTVLVRSIRNEWHHMGTPVKPDVLFASPTCR